MPTEVVIPMLGITIEKGKVLKWFKSEGNSVKKGEPLLEVETDKIVTDVESPGTGILKKIYISAGSRFLKTQILPFRIFPITARWLLC